MAEQERVARGQSSSKRSRRQRNDRDPAENGHDAEVASDEQELADYLEDRIKPGLNRGSIPLLARAIAKEIAQNRFRDGESDEAEGDTGPDLESALHELQSVLGSEWILYFSVHGKDSWLTAEKEDASQRVEAPTADVLIRAVDVLNEGGGRFRRHAREAR